jgi:hypothetical protein
MSKYSPVQVSSKLAIPLYKISSITKSKSNTANIFLLKQTNHILSVIPDVESDLDYFVVLKNWEKRQKKRLKI